MRNRIPIAIALLLAFATEAPAMGLNLAWDDCGAGGHCDKAFACDGNTGAPFTLVASFVPPAGTTRVSGEEVWLEVFSYGGYLPSWWTFRNAGACRQTSLQASIDFPSAGLTRCEDYWSAMGAGGVASYNMQYVGSGDRALLFMIFAVPIETTGPMDASREYYSCLVRILRDKTTGAGACAGCTTPMAMRLDKVSLTQPAGVGDFRITNPVTLSPSYDSRIATWQHGSYRYPNSLQYWSCPAAVPVHRSTWGSIKGQYR